MAMLKPKMTLSAVRGRILVTAEDGERIGPWGGTECFLSRQTGLGPCLVVRSSRHKRHEGTFFRLMRLQSVFSTYVVEGKLTVVVPHEQRVCTVYIETTADVDALRIMAAVLQDRNHWKDMEKNVACRKNRYSSGSRVKGHGLREVDALDGLEWDEGENNDGDDYNKEDNKDDDDVYGGGVSAQSKKRDMPSHAGAAQNALASSWGNAGNETIPAPSGMSWTAEQTRAIQLVRAGRNVFVTGSAGTGKTAWLMHILEHVLSRTEGTVVTATTGIAARLIGGCTVYAFAGIGRAEGTFHKIYQRVTSRPEVVRAWRQCKVLIIDEIAVLPVTVFVLLDEVARRVRNAPEKPFGGIQVILLGDFLQLPPVTTGTSAAVEPMSGDKIESAEGSNQTAKWCFECPLWEKLQLAAIEFRRNYRHENDPVFATCMEDIRYGRYTRRVANLFSACERRKLGERFGVEPTVIMARRQSAAAYNMERLQRLEDVHFYRYTSEDYASIPGFSLDKEVSLLSLLELRVGAQVVLLAALPDAPHLSNGDLGVVVAFAEQAHGAALPVVCFANSSGEEVVVPRVRMDVAGADGRTVATRTQIPLQLAWALTAHRVQGMTLPMVRVKLDASFFECGQAYVALTRVRRQEDISIVDCDPSVIRADPKAVAFYEKLFLRDSRPMQGEGSELVEVRRASKRPLSPVSVAAPGDAVTDDAQWRDERLFDSWTGSRTALAPQSVTTSALKFLAAAGSSAIPRLTQDSDAADPAWSNSQQRLLLDAE